MSHVIQSKKSWSWAYEDGKLRPIRWPFIRPGEEGFENSIANKVYDRDSYPDYNPLKFDQKYHFDPKWDSLNAIDACIREGWDYAEMTFKGTKDWFVEDAADQLKRIAGGDPNEEEGITPNVVDPITGEVIHQLEEYYVLWGDWIAEKKMGRAILVPKRLLWPEGRDRLTMKEVIGLRLRIRKDEQGKQITEDLLKIRKYFKRWKAPQVWSIKGRYGERGRVVVRDVDTLLKKPRKVTDVMGDTVMVTFDGVEEAKFLFIDLDQYCELDKDGKPIHTKDGKPVTDINPRVKDGKPVLDREQYAGDGNGFIDIGLVHDIGKATDNKDLMNAEVGDRFKVTGSIAEFFEKGLCGVRDFKDSPYKAIVYGPKLQLESEYAFFGSMGDIGELDDSMAYTEVQSIICIGTRKTKHLWEELAKDNIRLFFNAMNNEELFRYLFLVYMPHLAKRKETPDAELWCAIVAALNGMPILQHPAIRERVVRLFLEQVMDHKRGRIPYGKEAYLAMLQADDTMFDLNTGNIDVDLSEIGENQACLEDAPAGQTCCAHRRPFSNNQEAIFVVNLGAEKLSRGRYKMYKGRARCILGRGIREQYLIMQGADGDDQVVILIGKAWVQAFWDAAHDPLTKYPLTAMPKDVKELLDEPDDVNGSLEYEGPPIEEVSNLEDATEWVMGHLWEACDQALNLALTIGMVSNVNTHDQQCSGEHKLNMLASMYSCATQCEEDGDDEGFHITLALIDALEKRKEFECRIIGSHMEAVIDSIKMGKGSAALVTRLWAEATKVYNTSPVYPKCWEWMGTPVSKGGRGTRVPAKRVEAKDFMFATSILDEILASTKAGVDRLQKYAKNEDRIWQYAKPVPQAVRKMFPRNTETAGDAEWLMNTWKDTWTSYMSGEVDRVRTTDETDPEEQRRAMARIIVNGGVIYEMDGNSWILTGLRTSFIEMTTDANGQIDEARQCSIAVEIARLSYMVDYRNDKLLCQDFMFRAYARAWWESGVTSRYVPVKLDRRHGDLRIISMRALMVESMERAAVTKAGKEWTIPAGARMEVKVVKGRVLRASNSKFVGIPMEDIPDGDYTMLDSLIEVKPIKKGDSSIKD